jgi:hypothetical protein
VQRRGSMFIVTAFNVSALQTSSGPYVSCTDFREAA